MKYEFSQHLYWVLILGVFSVVICDDEPPRLPTTNAKSPLLRKYDIHRKTLKDESKKNLFSQPPDDTSSTTSVSEEWKGIVKHPNRTSDHLSRNTVPVFGPTEPTVKRGKVGSPGPGPLLAFKTLTTRTFTDSGIDLPPTGWALASMKTSKNTISPGISTKRPFTTPSIKPISGYWSSRLAKTTPSTFINDNIQQDAADSLKIENSQNLTETTTLKYNLTSVDNKIKSNGSNFDTIIKNASTFENLVKVAKPEVESSVTRPNVFTERPNSTEPVENTVPDEVNETKLFDQSTTSMTRATNTTQTPFEKTQTESSALNKTSDKTLETITTIGNDIPDITQKLKKSNFTLKEDILTTPSPVTNTTYTPIKSTVAEILMTFANAFNTSQNATVTTEKIVVKTEPSFQKTTAQYKPPWITVLLDAEKETTTEKNVKNSTLPNAIVDETTFSILVNESSSTEHTSSKPLSTETPTSSKPLSTDMPTSSKPLSTDMPTSFNPLSTDMLTSSKPLSTDTPTSPKPLSTYTFTSPKPQSTDTPTSSEPLSTDVPTSSTLITPTEEITTISPIITEIQNNTEKTTLIDKLNEINISTERTTLADKFNKINISTEKTTLEDNSNKINTSTEKIILEDKLNEINTTTEKTTVMDKLNKINITTEKTALEDKINEIKVTTEKILLDKSNEIKAKTEQTTETIIKIKTEPTSQTNTTYVSIPAKNLTEFHYDLENKTTPILKETVDIDDDDSLLYNTTSNEKIPNESDIDDDDDDLDKETEIHTTPKATETTTPLTTVTKISSTTPLINREIPNPSDERTTTEMDDSMFDGDVIPMNVELVIQAMYSEMCNVREELKEAIVKLFKTYASRSLSTKQVVLLDLGPRECYEHNDLIDISPATIHLMMTDKNGEYSKTLTEILVGLIRQGNFQFKFPVNKVDMLMSHQMDMSDEGQLGGTVIAAIVISSIAAVSLLFLTILLVIMRKRQKGFNYGQRCTPVSLDDYSLDNISVYNSVRRKAMRASKRSYGNPAFEDPVAISLPVNFAGLANTVNDKAKLEDEFSRVPTVTVKPDELPLGAETKNRYANVIPLPETRVHINTTTSNDIIDQFINANYVKGAKGADKFYIACQAPLSSTVADFWQMVWEQQSKIIIMLTDLHENGVEKCADYMPPSEVLDCHRVFGDLQVTLKKRESREKYTISSLQLKNLETNSWREVTHMWYISWPSRGIPDDPSSIIAFLIEARSFAKSGPPVVVHCSPGTGRTGTIIAIDIGIRDFETDRIVDIPKTVYNIRKERAGAVQTNEQYRLIYQVLHLYATKLTGGGLDSI